MKAIDMLVTMVKAQFTTLNETNYKIYDADNPDYYIHGFTYNREDDRIYFHCLEDKEEAEKEVTLLDKILRVNELVYKLNEEGAKLQVLVDEQSLEVRDEDNSFKTVGVYVQFTASFGAIDKVIEILDDRYKMSGGPGNETI